MPGLGRKDSVLERALIFLRFRLSLRDLFFFHFSLIICKQIVSADRTNANKDKDELLSDCGGVVCKAGQKS